MEASPATTTPPRTTWSSRFVTAASSLTGAYLLWDDADGEPVYRIDLTPPQLFVPTGSVITGEDVSAQIPGGTLTTLAQQFVSGNVNLFITTLAHPNGELTGTSFPLHPDYQPTLHFYVHSPVNLVPPVENEASGTGVMVWDTLERVRLLVTSADLPGVTGVNIASGYPRPERADHHQHPGCAGRWRGQRRPVRQVTNGG